MSHTLDRIRELAPGISKRSEEIEQARRVPLDLLDDLVSAGCFRMLVPPSHGGDGLALPDALAVIEELSRADGSTGWTVMIGATGPVVLGWLPRPAFDLIYANGPDVLGGGTLAPKGTAVPQDGGYRVTGQWPFASGCEHTTWLMVNAIVVEGDEPRRLPSGMPVMRALALPTSEVEIIDTWRVAGLRGTGSHDIRLTDAWCPEERTFAVAGAVSPLEDTLFRIPLLSQLGLYVAAVALGIARAAIDDVAALAAGGKQPAFSPRRLAESPLFQDRLGEADATLRAARALLFAEAERAWATALAGGEFSTLDRARLRATGPQVVGLSCAAVDTAYALGGGSSLYDTSPLQRRLRDMHAVTQHAGVGRDFYAVVGALLSGEEVDNFRI